MLTRQEKIYTMALTRIPRLGLRNSLLLYNALGSAQSIADNRKDLTAVVPEATEKLSKIILDGWDKAVERAEHEIDFLERHSVDCLCFNDDSYPQRLRNCDDAPLVIYYKGNVNLNAAHILCVVGTRNITEYGKDVCRNIMNDFSLLCPDVLVVSGLAYGVDVHAHRACLDAGINTVGVLAHGLDTLYPSIHRDVASKMVAHGGLVTEYMTATRPDKGNFVRRNRIIAGLSDACLVVESAAKGGSLITAGIAVDYNRDVFAVPGRSTDPYSEGCNRLISESSAQLVTSAEDIMKNIGWLSKKDEDSIKKKSAQLEIFPTLSLEEELIVKLLKGSDGKQLNRLVVEANIPIQKISSILFEMELRGIVKVMSGGRYRLLR